MCSITTGINYVVVNLMILEIIMFCCFFFIDASRLHNQDMMYFNNLDHDISKYDYD